MSSPTSSEQRSPRAAKSAAPVCHGASWLTLAEPPARLRVPLARLALLAGMPTPSRQNRSSVSRAFLPRWTPPGTRMDFVGAGLTPSVTLL
jgi:hypothetical protein